MNKKKQIKETTKDRVAELHLFYNFCKYNGCEEKTAEDCERCYFRKVYNRLAELEGNIRNGTLKEIAKDDVVLAREEYDKLTLKPSKLIVSSIEYPTKKVIGVCPTCKRSFETVYDTENERKFKQSLLKQLTCNHKEANK